MQERDDRGYLNSVQVGWPQKIYKLYPIDKYMYRSIKCYQIIMQIALVFRILKLAAYITMNLVIYTNHVDKNQSFWIMYSVHTVFYLFFTLHFILYYRLNCAESPRNNLYILSYAEIAGHDVRSEQIFFCSSLQKLEYCVSQTVQNVKFVQNPDRKENCLKKIQNHITMISYLSFKTLPSGISEYILQFGDIALFTILLIAFGALTTNNGIQTWADLQRVVLIVSLSLNFVNVFILVTFVALLIFVVAFSVYYLARIVSKKCGKNKKMANIRVEYFNKWKFQKDECQICKADYKENNISVLLSCKHIFHLSCIENQMTKVKSCPICNKEINQSEENLLQQKTLQLKDNLV